jgi:hypothetical protein
MAEDDFDEPGQWDEFQWERFLQQQDRNTEKYFGLLEKYLDHPDRDQIIAREMGWDEMDEDIADDWDEAAELFCEMENLEEEEEDADEEFESFVRSPVYGDTLRLHTWVNSWLDKLPESREDPDAIRLATRCAVCGAKLAAALCGDDNSEIGMTIAYLKRSLKAANDAHEAAATLVANKRMSARQARSFHKRLFAVRDRIVDFLSHYRAEWRKRNF